MSFRPPSYDDIVNSKYATAMPAATILPQTETRNYFQAIDNLIKVYAIRPTDRVLFLTDPLLDRRVVDAISGIANARGVSRTPTHTMMNPLTMKNSATANAPPCCMSDSGAHTHESTK